MSASSDARVAGGHVTVRTRALERVFTALAADVLGVAVNTVTVKVADARGALGVDVRSPFAVTHRTAGATGTAGSAGTVTVIEAAERVRDRVQTDGADLTGARIARVRVRITDTTMTTRRVS